MSLVYFYIILITVITNIIVLIFAFNQKKSEAIKAFIIFDSLVVTALLIYGMSLLVSDFSLKIAIHEAKFVAVAFFPIGYYYMICTYFGKYNYITRNKFLLLSIVPAIIVGAAITNPMHHLFRESFFPIINEYGYFVGVESSYIFFMFVVYAYTIYVISVAIAIKTFIETPKLFRTQIGLIIVASSCVFSVNLFMSSGIVFYDFGDATLISFSIGNMLIFYGFVIHKPAHLIKIARSSAMNEIANPILIFDYTNNLFDYNLSAQNLFGDKSNTTLDEFLNELGCEGDDFNFCKDDLIYSLSKREIIDDSGVFSGTALVFSNISDIKRRENVLEELAFRDYLTGIPNRQALISYLSKIKTDVMPVSVIHLNIIGMKNINNILGMKVGDEVLKKVASEIDKVENGFCARLNGDEFALILTNVAERSAQATIDRIRESLGNIELHSGLAVKQTLFDNIQIVFRESADDLNRNRIIYNAKN